jgi:hypothetical protein
MESLTDQTYTVRLVSDRTRMNHGPLSKHTSSIGIILINICDYGIPRSGIWLLRTMEVLFWIYVSLSVIASAGLYLILWSTLYVPFPPFQSSFTSDH